MIRYLVFILFLANFQLPCNAQNAREKAVKEIQDLKNGVLLIRIKQNSLKIRALEEHGHLSEAKEEAKRIEMERKEILMAFRTRYRFGKFYFFDSEHSNEIRNRNFSGFVFDTLLNPILLSKNTPFLTAEFGESQKMNFDALVVMDTNFVQLENPFPFMVKVNGGGLVKRSKVQVIEIWVSELERLFSKSLDYVPPKKRK